MATNRDTISRNAMRSMPSASFQLPSYQVKKLQVLAGTRQVSQSQVVREALDIALNDLSNMLSTDRIARDGAFGAGASVTESWARMARIPPIGRSRQLRRAAALLREQEAALVRLDRPAGQRQ